MIAHRQEPCMHPGNFTQSLHNIQKNKNYIKSHKITFYDFDVNPNLQPSPE